MLSLTTDLFCGLCLLQVELIEQPFTVITCSSILLVNLERIGFNLRNFDMTIVFKVWWHSLLRTSCTAGMGLVK